MGNGSYQLILEGVAEGFELEEVKEKLAAIFKTRPDKVAAFFTGKPVVVKKDVDNSTALKYKKIFEGAGATCRIEALDGKDDIPAPNMEEGEDDIPAYMIEEGEDDIPAHMIEEGEDDIPAHRMEKEAEALKVRAGTSMVCPKCGYEQAEARTCIRCGVMVDKFLKLMEKKQAEELDEEQQERPKVVLGIDKAFYEQRSEKQKPTADQTGFVSNLLSDSRRLVVFGAIAFLGTLGLLEFFVLRGDLVAKDSIRIDRRSDYIAILVDEPYEEYLVEVSTGKQGRKLSFLLEDPIGRIVYEETEYSLHKGSRRFTFKPEERGTFSLYINDGALGFGERGYAKVRVYMNDNRILGRIFEWLNF